MFINRKGQVTRRMHVVMKASWQPGNGLLEEEFKWSDGIDQNRIWHLKKTASGKYEGRADDVIVVDADDVK